MKIRVAKYDLPSFWASYLINGDSSSLTDNEIKEIDQYVKSRCEGGPVSVEDNEYFGQFRGIGYSLVTYIFHY